MDKESLKKKIMERVEIDAVTGCCNWVGKFTSNNYPYLCINGSDKKLVRRLSYEVFIGETGGYDVENNCKNTKCVNHSHLGLSIRGKKSGEITKTKMSLVERCKHGHPLDGTDKRNRRYCKTCQSLRSRKREKRPDVKNYLIEKRRRDLIKKREYDRKRYERLKDITS